MNMVEDLDIPVIISPGNHDPIFPGTSWLGETWPINTYIFNREKTVFEFPHLNTVIMGAAFEHQTAIKPSYFSGYSPDADSVFQLVVMHGDIVDHKSIFRPLPPDVIRNSNADFFAVGHNHQLIIKEDFDVPYASAGAPLGRSFSEPGSKAFLLGELSGDLLKGGRANLDLVTLKQMQKQKRITLRLDEYPLFLPGFISLEIFCSAEDDTAGIILSIQRKMSARKAFLHPDDLWSIDLLGEKTVQVDPSAIKDNLKRDLFFVEVRDKRRTRDFPGKGRRIIFPGLELKGSPIEKSDALDVAKQVDTQKNTSRHAREEAQRDLAITYLDAAAGVFTNPAHSDASQLPSHPGRKKSSPRRKR